MRFAIIALFFTSCQVVNIDMNESKENKGQHQPEKQTTLPTRIFQWDIKMSD